MDNRRGSNWGDQGDRGSARQGNYNSDDQERPDTQYVQQQEPSTHQTQGFNPGATTFVPSGSSQPTTRLDPLATSFNSFDPAQTPAELSPGVVTFHQQGLNFHHGFPISPGVPTWQPSSGNAQLGHQSGPLSQDQINAAVGNHWAYLHSQQPDGNSIFPGNQGNYVHNAYNQMPSFHQHATPESFPVQPQRAYQPQSNFNNYSTAGTRAAQGQLRHAHDQIFSNIPGQTTRLGYSTAPGNEAYDGDGGGSNIPEWRHGQSSGPPYANQSGRAQNQHVNTQYQGPGANVGYNALSNPSTISRFSNIGGDNFRSSFDHPAGFGNQSLSRDGRRDNQNQGIGGGFTMSRGGVPAGGPPTSRPTRFGGGMVYEFISRASSKDLY